MNPDEVVEKYGADALRMYEMFMGPLEDMKPWNINGIVGIVRFLDKVCKLYHEFIKSFEKNRDVHDREAERVLNKTIKKVTKDIEEFKFNTAISSMMEYINYMTGKKTKGSMSLMNIEYALKFIKILHPFAPFLTSELLEDVQKADKEMSGDLGFEKQDWPKYDSKLIVDETIELVLQINGKVRDKIEVEASISEEDAKKLALENEKIKQWTEGKEIIKIIFVKGKLLNIVIK